MRRPMRERRLPSPIPFCSCFRGKCRMEGRSMQRHSPPSSPASCSRTRRLLFSDCLLVFCAPRHACKVAHLSAQDAAHFSPAATAPGIGQAGKKKTANAKEGEWVSASAAPVFSSSCLQFAAEVFRGHRLPLFFFFLFDPRCRLPDVSHLVECSEASRDTERREREDLKRSSSS